MNSDNSLKLLGTLAVEKGWVTQGQISLAIAKQVDSPQKLGEILIEKSLINANQLNELLDLHTQRVFQQDEIQFGQMAIKNKFVTKDIIDTCLKKQIGTNKLLGEILISNGYITLQQCNAILNSQQRLLLNDNHKPNSNLVSCPRCLSTYKIKDPERPRELRCSKCKMIFEWLADNKESIKIHHGSYSNPKDELMPGLTVQTKLINENNREITTIDDDFSKLKTFLIENKIVPDEYLEKNEIKKYISNNRYDMGKEIDRGGMGVILATKDLNINRDIVTKVLYSKYSKAKVLRFIREAQINGQLEHPNIVPVHDLGMNSNGQIYFTMKWVKGESLREILGKLELENKEYQLKYTSHVLIEIVKKVCDALAYVHSKKIIHRDLKPDNIMVGEFGEVQLMDWGLAKVIGDKENSVESLEESSAVTHEKDASKTIVGTCIGTPEYMSPEQARGDLDHMDERTDVYGIGGVLHSCISLTTPVKGSSFENIIAKVISGRINPLPKNTPPELVAIIKKAMAINSEDRYQSISEFTADLKAFQSGYAVSVKHDTFIEAIGKVIKRNKAITIAGIFSIFALIIGLGISIWQWKEAIKQKDLAEKNLLLALDNEKKIIFERETGKKKLEDQKKEQISKKAEMAVEAVRRGREYLSQANATDHKFSNSNAIEKNRDFYNAANCFRQALIHNNENEEAKKGLYETGKKHFELSLWLESFEQAETNISDMKVVGLNQNEILEFQVFLDQAKSQKERKVRERVKFLMEDAKLNNRKVIHEAASKELISLKSKLTVELLKEFIDSKNSNCQKLAIDSLAWMEDPTVAVMIVPYIHKKYSNGKQIPLEIQTSSILAICILKPKSVLIYNAVRDRIWEEHDNINSLLFTQIKLFFEPYAELMSEIVAESLKGSVKVDEWVMQGIKYKEANQFQKSIESFSKAIELNPESFMAYNNRGLVKYFIGDFNGGLLDFNRAIELSPNESSFYNNRGSLRMSTNKYKEGIADYNKAIELNPNNLEVYNNRGAAKKLMGDMSGALEDFNYILNINPEHIKAIINRGMVKNGLGDFKSAIQDFDLAIQLNPNTFEAYVNRGNSKVNLREFEESILDFNKAIALKPNAEIAYYNRGNAKENLRDFEGALSDFDKVIGINPNYEYSYFKRGTQKINLGDYESAICDFRESIKIYPELWENWYAIAIIAYTLKLKDKYEEAMNKLKVLHPKFDDIEKKIKIEGEKSFAKYEGLRLQNKTLSTANDYFVRGNYFYEVKAYKKAEEDYLKAIELDSSYGEKGCFVKLLYISSAEKNNFKINKYYDLWLKINPDNIVIRNDYAWFLVTVEDKKLLNLELGLSYALKAAEQTEFKDPATLDTLALTYFKNNKLNEAVTTAKKALTLLPNDYPLDQRKEFETKLSEYQSALDKQKQ